MRKARFFGIAAFIAVAVWFTGCEQAILGGNTPAIERSLNGSSVDNAASVGAAPAVWTQITDTTFINTFGGGSIWAADYGPVAAGSSNYVFVAGGDSGAAAYSADGVTWTAIPSTATGGNTINGIANDGNGTFIMVAFNGYLAYTNNITSGNWKTLDGNDTKMNGATIYAIAYGIASERFVIGGNGGAAAYSDTKGVSWLSLPDLAPIFIAGNNSNIRAISVYYDSYGVYGYTDIFLAVGGRSGMAPMPNAAAYSTASGDVNSWQRTSNNVFSRGLTIGSIGSNPAVPYFVASGYDMSTNNVAYIQPYNLDFNLWTQVPTGTTGVSGWLDSIGFGGGYYVGVGVNGQITYTNDLVKWNPVTLSGAGGYIDGIGYGDHLPSSSGVTTRFVAVGDRGYGAYTTYQVSAPAAE
jgi:hypothetical protein